MLKTCHITMLKMQSPMLRAVLEKSCQELKLQKSPRKKKKLATVYPDKPPIVIMFQDLEEFPAKILQDFILTTSVHIPSLPIVLVFGVATSWSDVSERLFPHSTIVHLSVKTFSAPTASSHLALIVDEILLSWNHPFKLSGRCLQLLLDVFLCHDFSITNFLHSLKFCVLEHFYEKSSSVLCTLSLSNALDVVVKFSKSEIKEMKSLPSLQRYAKLSEENLLGINKLNKDLVRKFLEDLHFHHQNYFLILRCLNSLTSTLPQYPMGKQLREVYIACSRNELRDYSGFKEAFTFLKVSSRDQLIDKLKACIDCLSSATSSLPQKFSVSNAAQKMQDAIDEFQRIGKNPVDDDDILDESGDAEDSLESVKYVHLLQERLRNRSKHKKQKKMTKFEKVREEIVNFLREFFISHLRPPQSFPLYEAFYFDSVVDIKRHLVAAPRLSLQTALSNPYKYLKVASLESLASGLIPANAPDICVAYKLHNECGSLINLFDWMQAFHTVVTSSDRNDHQREAEIDEVTQARFIRAVSELQFLGYIRSTKRKTDHVQRLTWSHV